jgi:hypothetical protein
METADEKRRCSLSPQEKQNGDVSRNRIERTERMCRRKGCQRPVYVEFLWPSGTEYYCSAGHAQGVICQACQGQGCPSCAQSGFELIQIWEVFPGELET